jgi:hypothetical protein
MSIGSMSWACLLLSLSAGLPPDVFPMNQRTFQIPITFAPERKAEIKDLTLWVSRDEGKSWEGYTKTTPDKDAFDFTADRDGVYWFVVQVTTKKGETQPPDASHAPVGQKILVDTLKPAVHLTADRQGDEVTVNWDVIEANPDLASLKVEYHGADMPAEQWTPVPNLPAPPLSRVTFKPGPSALTVRLQLLDVAGNVGHAEVQVPAASSMRPVSAETATGPEPAGPLPRDVVRTPVNPEDRGAPLPTEKHDTPEAPGAPSSGPSSLTAALPPLQIINKKQVKLDFEVGECGPSGIGSVEVYVTMDDGHTWEKSAIDANTMLPPATDVRAGQPLHGSVMVQLNKPEPAVYGFYLVVKSRAGRGKPAPRSGDLPQVRVEVDTTPPAADLYPIKPDPSQRDVLILTWKATDHNLTAKPITLEWAEQKDGPWFPIGPAELPNTGSYAWQVPANVPWQVYLRLTARDSAGNVAVAETHQPVLVDLSEPQVKTVSATVAGK